jgi:subtilisin-like proprotein convertase family protein
MKNLNNIICFQFLLTFCLISNILFAQPQGTNTVYCKNNFKLIIKDDVASLYHAPLNIYGVPDSSVVTDINVFLDIDHERLNQLDISLISPFGLQSTLFTSNSCPFDDAKNIYTLLDDQAYDLGYFKTYGVKVPANFTCLSGKLKAIGAFNIETLYLGSEKVTIGKMRPQVDLLKIFNGTPLLSDIQNIKISLKDSQINPVTKQLSNFDITYTISQLNLNPGNLLTLKYVKSNGLNISGLETSAYYIFKVIDLNTIQFVDNYGSINDVQLGSTHTFTWSPQWILRVNDNKKNAGGTIKNVNLQISFDKKVKKIFKIAKVDNNGITNQKLIQTLSDDELTNNSTVVHQNYPNPFNVSTIIPFELQKPGMVEINFFDASNNLVKSYTKYYDAGQNNFELFASEIPYSGYLYYQLKTENEVLNKSMLLLK